MVMAVYDESKWNRGGEMKRDERMVAEMGNFSDINEPV
jgi:hypothetical protein